MASHSGEKRSTPGPFQPTLILHGGAGSISRGNLPPELYARYHASLLKYLTLARGLLDSGASALDAACHAVSLFEDDPLFNCGRGAVFTEQGTIEMEASVMVCSANTAGPPAGKIKRGAAVSLIRNTRHPILLAKELLLSADEDGGLGGTSTMHCHLSGREVEEWGWKDKGLEEKPDRWFWTKKRWEEHRRGLHRSDSYSYRDLLASVDPFSPTINEDENIDVPEIPSQGTVGAVCLDSWGNLAVATSTGGLTNKKAGRIGDTPTIGAGFWAEAWDESVSDASQSPGRETQPGSYPQERMPFVHQLLTQASDIMGPCLDVFGAERRETSPNDARPPYAPIPVPSYQRYPSPSSVRSSWNRSVQKRSRAVAMSGTGNGDSFLRTDAVRTAASLCRFPGVAPMSLSDAVRAVAGPEGELQRSAGDRWGQTGEGQGGIIGIEVVNDDVIYNMETKSQMSKKKKKGLPVFDFNCGGLFRAYYEVHNGEGDEETEQPKVMVFKEEY